MALSVAEFREYSKRAAKTLAKKTKFEVEFSKQLNKFFATITSDVKKHEAIVDMQHYYSDLEKMLYDHHVKVGDDFSDYYRTLFNADIPKIDDQMDRYISTFARSRSNMVAHSILDTTSDRLHAIVKDNMQQPVKNPWKSIVADFGVDNRIRVPTINMTETATAAEFTKFTEAVMSGIGGDAGKKVWIATLTDHTREAHAEADGDEVPFDEPFTVWDEQLMHPLDSSLGATAKNIINCYCTSEPIYNIAKTLYFV